MSGPMANIREWWPVILPFTLMWASVLVLEVIMLPERIRLVNYGGHRYIWPYTNKYDDLRVPGWIIHACHLSTIIWAVQGLYMLLTYKSPANNEWDALTAALQSESVVWGMVIMLPWQIRSLQQNSERTLIGPLASYAGQGLRRHGGTLPRRVSPLRSRLWWGFEPMIPAYGVLLVNLPLTVLLTAVVLLL